MARRQGTSGKGAKTQGVGEETPADPKGLKTLSEEADKTLGEKGGTIANALGDKAEAGSIACAKLLVELAERKKRVKRRVGAKKVAESLAEQLAREPEWPLRPKPGKDAGAPEPRNVDAQGDAGPLRRG